MSPERFQKIFEYANEAIFLLDSERDQILDANAKGCRTLGYSREELLSTPVSAIHPEEMSELLAFARSVFNQGSGWTDRFSCRTKSGVIMSAEISAALIELGGRQCLVDVVRDASERQREEAVWRAIVAGTAAVTGVDFLRSLVQRLASVLGVRYAFIAEFASVRTRLRTLAFWASEKFLEGVEYELANTACQQVLAGNMIHYPDNVQAQFPGSHDLAQLRAVSYLGIPLCDRSGTVLGHIAVIDDKPMPVAPLELSVFKLFAERAGAELERGRMEAALRKSEEQLRVLANSLPVLIAYADTEERYVFNNVGYEKWFGVSAEALKGHRVGEFIGESKYAAVQPRIRAALSGRPQRFEIELQHQNLGARSVEMLYVPHGDPEGRTRMRKLGIRKPEYTH